MIIPLPSFPLFLITGIFILWDLYIRKSLTGIFILTGFLQPLFIYSLYTCPGYVSPFRYRFLFSTTSQIFSRRCRKIYFPCNTSFKTRLTDPTHLCAFTRTLTYSRFQNVLTQSKIITLNTVIFWTSEASSQFWLDRLAFICLSTCLEYVTR